MKHQPTLPNQPEVAVVGATGAVGRTIIDILEERHFPISGFVPVASERSAGETLDLNGTEETVQTPGNVNWSDIDLALVSAGSDLSKQLAPELVRNEVLVVDNSSAFRMDPDTPLVVPEVNWSEEVRNANPIANPNCSASQLVMVLKPLLDQFGLERVVVTTYQSVSGAGGQALDEFEEQTSKSDSDGGNFSPTSEFRDPIHRNVLPFIPHGSDTEVPFGEATGEEAKVVQETQKILNEPELEISVTCARIPVSVCHAEAVHLSLEDRNFSLSDVLETLSEFPGVQPVEDGTRADYPQPINAAGRDPVFVGRLRKDHGLPGGLALWCVGDNLRKGAALNTVQIAEHFLEPPSA